MVKVVITGGSGFIGTHLLQYLEENDSELVTEIHTIDRRPELKYNGSQKIPITHHSFDLNDSERLETVLRNADLVFHLARRQFEYLIESSKKLNEEYIHDNLNAVESLVNSMMRANANRLVFVGDAFANLPSGDNFGNSEGIHDGFPSSFMLGTYGESRTRGEVFARRKVGSLTANGSPFLATFLRPVFLYGEGSRTLPEALRTVAQNNGDRLPYIPGPSNGLLQFMYVGNLAALLSENMRELMKNPERLSGEFLYVMDETRSRLFATEFAAPILECFGQKLGKPESLLWSYGRTIWSEWNSSVGFSLSALRLLFIYASGFSNRKQQLLFRYRSDETADGYERTIRWISQTLGNDRQKAVLRMG